MILESEPENPTSRGARKVSSTAAACVAILIFTVGIVYRIQSTEPTAQKGDVMRRSAALVNVVEVERGDHRPEIAVLGTVEAARSMDLSPRVSGEITTMAPSFEPGGLVARGATLVSIDAADFRTQLAMRESELREARANLAIEEGRRTVAELELALLDDDAEPYDRALVLREPQIESARARVDAAVAAVEKAELDLERTSVRAPFDGQVLTRDVDLGSQIGPGDRLGRLVGIDKAWVVATVPIRTLARLQFAGDDAPGSRVRIRDRTAWEPGVFRDGHLTRLIGTVDERTRLARVLITVEDPFALANEAPRFLLGTVVEVRIEGKILGDVARVDRELVREGDTVWVFADGKLEIRSVKVVFRDAENAYVTEGLEGGERVVTTNLATVATGIELSLVQDGDGVQ